MTIFERLRPFIHELPQSLYAAQEAHSKERLSSVDEEDWPVLACALGLECAIWTEDRDFFGAGVATWTSARVEIYLRSAPNSDPS
jgi:predicted nucleic acid-binding protein